METIELYSPADLARLKTQKRRWSAALWSFSGAALLCCVLFCLRTNTANAAQMERWTVIVSTLAGWIVITLGTDVVAARKREAAHVQHMLTGPREEQEGTLVLTEEFISIRGSVRVRRGVLQTEDGTRRLLIHAKRADRLKPGRVRISTVHDYVVAAEVLP